MGVKPNIAKSDLMTFLKSRWKMISYLVLSLAFLYSARFFDGLPQYIFFAPLAAFVVYDFLIKRIYSDEWRYYHRNLSSEALGHRAYLDIVYIGLIFIITREEDIVPVQINKIVTLMKEHFEDETFAWMVEDDIADKEFGGRSQKKTFKSIKMIQRHLPAEAFPKAKAIFYKFAFDQKATTPSIKKGYEKLIRVVNN